jgi:RNA polymerase sigma-70 factor (ECF subfamily)
MKGLENNGGDDVEDERIVELYWERSEAAISESAKKYGKYCHYIAYNVLSSDQDAEECVNDTYLRAWAAIPPTRPRVLKSFLGTITRNLAIDRYNKERAEKRLGNADLAFEELGECIPDGNEDGRALSDEMALRDAINGFLESLPKETRIIFVRRYWYLSPVAHIAGDLGMSNSNVKVILMRTRKKLKAYLEKENITI